MSVLHPGPAQDQLPLVLADPGTSLRRKLWGFNSLRADHTLASGPSAEATNLGCGCSTQPEGAMMRGRRGRQPGLISQVCRDRLSGPQPIAGTPGWEALLIRATERVRVPHQRPIIPGSSNGRTWVFEAQYQGSIPWPGTMQDEQAGESTRLTREIRWVRSPRPVPCGVGRLARHLPYKETQVGSIPSPRTMRA